MSSFSCGKDHSDDIQVPLHIRTDIYASHEMVVWLHLHLICLIWWKTLILKNRINLALLWRRQWQPTPVLLPGKSHGWRSLVGCSPWGREELDTNERLPFHFSLSLEKEMATHSSVLAWRIPGVVEPGGLPSMGLHRVGHDWSDLAAAALLYTHDQDILSFLSTVKFNLLLFLQGLSVYIHEGYWSVPYNSCNIFVKFWYQD